MKVFPLSLLSMLVLVGACLAGSLDSPNFRVDAVPEKGFSYPYYLHIPPNLRDRKARSRIHTLLVVPNNTGQPNDDLAIHESKVKYKMFQAGIVFSRLELPILMPVFPRPKKHWKIYTHALDRDTMITGKKEFRRLDLQLASMIKHARERLRAEEVQVEERVLLYGYSAAGMFVNRFSFLHPKQVKGVAAGSPGGWAIVPVKEYRGRNLKYPIGIGDLRGVSGQPPNLDALRKIPMFIFLGDQDDNDSVVFRDGYEQEDEELVFELFGKTPVERWEISKTLYKKSGMNARFKLYPEIGHKVSPEMVKDILGFLAKHKN